jgi:C4-dicarboxylate-specific signal transduction histidine kinase/ligand-binding sensor domain-containing protein
MRCDQETSGTLCRQTISVLKSRTHETILSLCVRLCCVRRKGGPGYRVLGARRLVGLLLAVYTLVGLCASPAQSVRPYQPTKLDPVADPWRWQQFPKLRGLGLQCMAQAVDSTMWFGTEEGVWSYDGVRWTAYGPEACLLRGTVMAICAASGGGVYAASASGISQFRAGEWGPVFIPGGDLHWPTYDLEQGPDGTLWAGTAWGLLRINQDDRTLFAMQEMVPILAELSSGVRIQAVSDSLLPGRTGTFGHAFYTCGDLLLYNIGGWFGSREMRVGKVPRAVCVRASEDKQHTPRLQSGDVVLHLEGNRPLLTDLAGDTEEQVTLIVERESEAEQVAVQAQGRGWRAIAARFAVYDVCLAPDGGMWLALADGDLVQCGIRWTDPRSWTRHGAEHGLRIGLLPRVLQDREGRVWAASDEKTAGLNLLDRGLWTHTDLRGVGGNPINGSLLETSDGTVWISGYNVMHAYTEGALRIYMHGSIPISLGGRITNLLETSDGAIWMMVEGKEAIRFDPTGRRWDSYDGLLFQCETESGEQWFLSADNGAVSRRDGKWRRYGTEDGLMDAPIRLINGPGGVLWAAGSHRSVASTGRFQPGADGSVTGRWRIETHPRLAWGIDARAIHVAADSSIWFGAPNGRPGEGRQAGLIQYVPSGRPGSGTGRWVKHAPPHAPPRCYGIGETPDGGIWGGVIGLNRFDGTVWHEISEPPELTVPFIQWICTGRDGRMWVGTQLYGILTYERGTWTRYDQRQGLPGNAIRSIMEAADGTVWAATTEGIARFDGITWTSGVLPPKFTHVRLSEAQDGSVWISGNESSAGWAYRGMPGNTRFTFGINTHRYVPDRLAPDVQISVSPESVSQPGNTTITWEGVDPWAPADRLLYSHRLDGSPWSQYASDTSVTLLALPDGHHRFEVRARDLDFNVDPTPAAVTFTVLPPVWRQPWVLALMGILSCAVALQTGRVVRRGRRLARANKALTREVREREQAEVAREKLDVQLQQMKYLYGLREALGGVRGVDDAIRVLGRHVMAVLSSVGDGGVSVELNGDRRGFGRTDSPGGRSYARDLAWGGRVRGRLQVHVMTELTESQEHTLLDETAGQLSGVLEAQELEMQLLQSARLVSLGEMSAGVAHEMNQPLGAISTTAGDVYLRLLEGIPLPEDELKEMMQDVVRMTGRLGQTVEHLRIFSRDASEEEAVKVSLNDVIENALQLMGTQLGSHGIHIGLDLGEATPSLMGHPYQLEQVILNLLANARDALDERGVGDGSVPAAQKRIEIRTRYESGAVPQVIAEIEDNGVGIDPAVQHRLFEPFYTTKEADRGTGLGLSISHAMVRNHGGEISVASEPGTGAVFRVTIPVSGGV